MSGGGGGGPKPHHVQKKTTLLDLVRKNLSFRRFDRLATVQPCATTVLAALQRSIVGAGLRAISVHASRPSRFKGRINHIELKQQYCDHVLHKEVTLPLAIDGNVSNVAPHSPK